MPPQYKTHLRRICIEPGCNRKIQSSAKKEIHRCGTCCRLIRRAKKAALNQSTERVFNNPISQDGFESILPRAAEDAGQ